MAHLAAVEATLKSRLHTTNDVKRATRIELAKLTPWSRVLPEELTDPELVKKSPHFMETEGPLPHSQEPATCPYP
jgi:hypothetical protein